VCRGPPSSVARITEVIMMTGRNTTPTSSGSACVLSCAVVAEHLVARRFLRCKRKPGSKRVSANNPTQQASVKRLGHYEGVVPARGRRDAASE
jgi:hypothetical protein